MEGTGRKEGRKEGGIDHNAGLARPLLLFVPLPPPFHAATQGDIVRWSGFEEGVGGRAKQSSHTSLLDHCQIPQRI